MVQAKISAFFGPTTASDETRISSPSQMKGKEEPEEGGTEVLITYKRRIPETKSHCEELCQPDNLESGTPNIHPEANPSINSYSMPKVLNNKRKYVQSHLELGQSDFLLHTCSSCGLRYTCGKEEDEKVHKAYHKNYLQGIRFMGWCNERIVLVFESTADRIVLVKADDPPPQKRKVQEIAKSMENDLYCGVDWLLNQFYQAYLFISKNRVAGCLIIQPIKVAYKLVSNSMLARSSSDGTVNEAAKLNPSVSVTHNSSLGKHSASLLKFGNISLQREIVKKRHTTSTYSQQVEPLYTGAILCEKDPTPALCGIRAIWVAPSCRRQHIATKLLDAARKNFGIDREVEPSECAFSQPTSLGCAFASSYCRTSPFLVYKDSC